MFFYLKNITYYDEIKFHHNKEFIMMKYGFVIICPCYYDEPKYHRNKSYILVQVIKKICLFFI